MTNLRKDRVGAENYDIANIKSKKEMKNIYIFKSFQLVLSDD